MIAAWRLITAALGVSAGACACALCGASPHPRAKTLREFLPAHFPHPELLAPGVTDICAGCVALFGGKPSKTSLGLFQKVRDLYPYLLEPETVAVFSWSTSLQKHRSESRSRAYNYARRGALYLQSSGRWTLAPIATWSAEEVLGYVLAEDRLPVNPVYTKWQLAPDDLDRMRDGTWYPRETADANGYADWLRYHYPELEASYLRATQLKSGG